MPDIPSDDPAGLHDPEDWDDEPGTVSLRPVAIVVGILLLAAVAYLGYSCSRASGGGGVFSDQDTHYAPGSVTYLAPGRTYLVRRTDGSFVALSEIEASDADRVAGCVIRYRPDLSAAGQTGVFRDDCHGTLFNRDGIAVEGSVPPMQRHEVSSDGKIVTVRFRVCLNAASAQVEPCRV